MAVLVVLFVSWIAFRAAGAFGVHVFATWQSSAAYALAVMFLFTAIAHFTSTRHDLARMVPDIFPKPMLLVYISGVLEFLGFLGLLLPRFRFAAAVCLILLLVALFPANVNAARQHLTLRGKPATPLALRLPMQLLFIGLLGWSCLR
ncbi:MAG TPA: hypothetical protein VKR52_17700 [Terracidiphilus sp.]|nr:hypothetical protein [Terracidiphilus sp.]